MSTRDDARRELRDLGKRVPPLPADRPSDSQHAREPSNGMTGSHITVPPAVASVPARKPFPAIATGSMSNPLRGDAWPVAVFRTAFGEGSGWRGLWAVLAGGTLAAAMVGGVVLGQALTSRFSAQSGMDEGAIANSLTPVAEAPPAPVPPAAAAPANPEIPTIASPTALPTAVEGSSIATLRAPHLPHHVEFRPPPRQVIVIAPQQGSAGPRAAVSAKPAAAHPNPQDALEELIRKAASGS